MNESYDATTVGAIVAGDFRTAAVFEQFGIDFCCGGRRSLAEACRTAAVDPATVAAALEALPTDGAHADDVADWPADRLIDHIVAVHHAYVRTAIPSIARLLAKIVEVHGVRHPELRRIAVAFEQIGRDLLQHLAKEEQVLFPYVRELARGAYHDASTSPFGTVENPIRMMEREHREAGDEMRLIRELSRGYTVPEDGCTAYAACLDELARFERDLHRHIHLENNVLFPKAIELERGGPPHIDD